MRFYFIVCSNMVFFSSSPLLQHICTYMNNLDNCVKSQVIPFQRCNTFISTQFLSPDIETVERNNSENSWYCKKREICVLRRELFRFFCVLTAHTSFSPSFFSLHLFRTYAAFSLFTIPAFQNLFFASWHRHPFCLPKIYP